MAKAVGFIGGISGKVGNVVFGGTAKNGEAIMRKYNPNVNNPKTARQQRSRAIFAMAGAGLRPFLPALRLGWQDSAPSRQFQKVMSKVCPWSAGFFTESGGTLTFDVENNIDRVMSQNQIGQIGFGTQDWDTAGQVSVQAIVPESMGKDEGGNTVGVGIVLCAYSKDLKECVFENVVGTTGTNDITMELPARWSGLRVFVYGFVKQIPTSANGIASTTEPWMFPSKTSSTCVLAQGELL